MRRAAPPTVVSTGGEALPADAAPTAPARPAAPPRRVPRLRTAARPPPATAPAPLPAAFRTCVRRRRRRRRPQAPDPTSPPTASGSTKRANGSTPGARRSGSPPPRGPRRRRGPRRVVRGGLPGRGRLRRGRRGRVLPRGAPRVRRGRPGLLPRRRGEPAAPPEAAVRTAQRHLDMLLSALLSAGDASDALTRVRGSVPPANARRILAHTREPEEALRRVTPALATEPRRRGGGHFQEARSGSRSSASARVGRGPGLRARARPFSGPQGRCRAPSSAPVREAPRTSTGRTPPRRSPFSGRRAPPRDSCAREGRGERLGRALDPLASFPEGLATGETARELLRRAERWGEAEPLHFAGPLGFALLLAR